MAAAAISTSSKRNISPPMVYNVDTSEEYVSLLAKLGIEAACEGMEGSYGRVSPHPEDPNLVVKFQSPVRKPIEEQVARMQMATREVFIQLSLRGIPCVPLISDIVICSTGRLAFVMQNGGDDIFTLFFEKNRIPPLINLQSYINTWLKGLSAIHAKGVIHLDIKPENFTPDLILDYGLSVQLKDKKASGRRGTPEYMSPEMILGEKFGFKHDSFSFGIMLFSLFQMEYLIPIVPKNPEERTIYERKIIEGDIQTQIDHLSLLQNALGKIPQKFLKERKDICTLDEATQEWVLKPSSKVPRYEKNLRERMLSNERCARYDRKNIYLLVDLVEKLTHLDPDKRISCEEASSHPFLTTPIERALQSQQKPSFDRLDLLVKEALLRREKEEAEILRHELEAFSLEPPALSSKPGDAKKVRVATFREQPDQKN